jgi:hypothetical protein
VAANLIVGRMREKESVPDFQSPSSASWLPSMSLMSVRPPAFYSYIYVPPLLCTTPHHSFKNTNSLSASSALANHDYLSQVHLARSRVSILASPLLTHTAGPLAHTNTMTTTAIRQQARGSATSRSPASCPATSIYDHGSPQVEIPNNIGTANYRLPRAHRSWAWFRPATREYIVQAGCFSDLCKKIPRSRAFTGSDRRTKPNENCKKNAAILQFQPIYEIC